MRKTIPALRRELEHERTETEAHEYWAGVHRRRAESAKTQIKNIRRNVKAQNQHDELYLELVRLQGKDNDLRDAASASAKAEADELLVGRQSKPQAREPEQ